MYIRVEAEVRPTESVSKVLKAVSTLIFTDNAKVEDLSKGYKMIVIESTDLESIKPLYNSLRKQQILDTARDYMYKHKRGETVIIMVNKQAAYQGYVSFVESHSESPLGAIVMTISSPQIDKVIDWLAPRTAHGKPLWELSLPKDV